MLNQYEEFYSGYVSERTQTGWTPLNKVKEMLCFVDLTKEERIEAGGLPVISDGHSMAYIDTSDAHTVIEAISGMKKSICAFMPLICMFALAGENMVVHDMKGELYARTANFLKKQGYRIICVNLRNFSGDGYNMFSYPYRLNKRGEKDLAAMRLTDVISVISERQRSGMVDPFWPDTAINALTPEAAIMLDCYTEEEANIMSLANFNTEDGVSNLRTLLGAIKTKNTYTTALRTVLAEPEKTLMSTLSTVSAMLKPYIQNEKLVRMLSHSTFHIEDMSNPKTALFIVTDDTTDAYTEIAGVLISQIQSYLVNLAYTLPKGKLDTRVNFILDEFTSLTLPQMENALAGHRSRGMRYYLCVQSIDLLRLRYKSYISLMANCANTLFMGSTEREMLEKVSLECGTTRTTHDGREEPIITPAELMTLRKTWDSKEAIYLNLSENIRYCTTLPAIEQYDMFTRYGIAELPHVKHPDVRVYTPDELLRDIKRGTRKLPFAEAPEPKPSGKSTRKGSDRSKKEQGEAYNIEEELNKLYDEIFGELIDEEDQ